MKSIAFCFMSVCILCHVILYFDANKDAICVRLHPYLVRVNKKGKAYLLPSLRQR